MNISAMIDVREKGKREILTLYCEEKNVLKMMKFIKIVKKYPQCYSCDDLSVIQVFLEGSPDELVKIEKDLKEKGYKIAFD